MSTVVSRRVLRPRLGGQPPSYDTTSPCGLSPSPKLWKRKMENWRPTIKCLGSDVTPVTSALISLARTSHMATSNFKQVGTYNPCVPGSTENLTLVNPWWCPSQSHSWQRFNPRLPNSQASLFITAPLLSSAPPGGMANNPSCETASNGHGLGKVGGVGD